MRQLDYWFSNDAILLNPEMKKAPQCGAFVVNRSLRFVTS